MGNNQNNKTLVHRMWNAVDILRRDSNVDGIMGCIAHIAWLMFLRFLDQEEKRRAEQVRITGEPYTPVLADDLAWDKWASPEALEKWDLEAGELGTFIRKKLFPHLAFLDGSPLAHTISAIFSDDISSEKVVRNLPVCGSDYNLRDVISIIDRISFDREDDVFAISQFYEDLLARLGIENQIAGEFMTPRPVVRFMVQVIDPQIGETIYDPACGTAGFLAQAYLHLEKQVNEKNKAILRSYIYGQEKKGITALLGTMNLVLHGMSHHCITRTNTLEENITEEVERRYDIILTNPPFGGLEGPHIQKNFPFRSSATEILFLQHIMKKLSNNPNARAAVVVPEGVLFRSGVFASVKKWLLDEFHLFAVVSLPAGVFAPYSDIKTSLLFFCRPERTTLRNPIAARETWYYELPLPSGLKKFSKADPVRDEHFAEAYMLWERWYNWLNGQSERPFALAGDIRSSRVTHQGEQDNQSPHNTWVERIDDLIARDYDLSARNPYIANYQRSDKSPSEIVADLRQHLHLLQESIERLHQMINDDNWWQLTDDKQQESFS